MNEITTAADLQTRKRFALTSPALDALRGDLMLMGTVMDSITQVVDAPTLRRVRQMRAQLFGALASVVVTGAPGSGVSSLVRALAGGAGPGAEPPTLRDARPPLAKLARQPLPVDLIELPEAMDPAVLAERAAQVGGLDTELCVAVFPAPRLLTADDFQMVRLLRGAADRQPIFFINQIDLLDHPVADTEQIRRRIVAMAARHATGTTPLMVFGSLRWAEVGLIDRLCDLPDQSRRSMIRLLEAGEEVEALTAAELGWQMSGMAALAEAIGQGIACGPLPRAMSRAERQLRTALAGGDPDPTTAAVMFDGTLTAQLSQAEVVHRVEVLARRLQSELRSETAVLVAEFRARMAKAGALFVDTAVAEMVAHMEREGPPLHWEVDPVRLRIQLRAACLGFAQSCRALTDRMLRRAARELVVIYRDLLGPAGAAAVPEPPPGSFVAVPALDGGTISIDMQAGAWRWRLRASQNSAAQVREFRARVSEENEALLAEVEARHRSAPVDAVRATLGAFLQAQADGLAAMAKARAVGPDLLSRALFGEDRHEKAAIRAAALQALDAAAAAGRPTLGQTGGS